MNAAHHPRPAVPRAGRRPGLGSARPALGFALAACLVGAGVTAVPRLAAADTAPATGVTRTVSAQSLPTWQINGVVWDQEIVGNTVYVVGSFSQARPPGVAVGGAGSVPAGNVFAYDIRNGQRVAEFDHVLNGQALAITKSHDGSKLFVGGDFTSVDGYARGHVAVFDVATGALLDSPTMTLDGPVRTISASETTVYLGGTFSRANDVYRKQLAAFDIASGALTRWAPTPDNNGVRALVVAPGGDRVVVGGQFQTMNGENVYGHGAVDAATGENVTWKANATIRSYNNGGITSLRTDGVSIYGTAFAFGSGGTFEGSFRAEPADGEITWLADCLGDSYDIGTLEGVAYQVGHSHDCRSIGGFPEMSPRVHERATAFTMAPNGVNRGPNAYGWNYNDQPKPDSLHWWPELASGKYTGQNQGPWTIDSANGYLALGGEFPTVNGMPQQGLARFTFTERHAYTRPPRWQTYPTRTITAPVASVMSNGMVRVVHQSAWDQDNEHLKYELIRDPGTADASVVSTKTASTSFWILPDQSTFDPNPPPGTHTYQVRVTDPNGQAVTSAVSGPVTTNGPVTPLTPYAMAVLADSPTNYWRLDESSGSTLADSAGSLNGRTQSGFSLAAPGALGDDGSGATLSGTASGTAFAGTVGGPQRFSVEAWFKTASARGGKIVGFGNRTGSSTTNDRHVYLDADGRLTFGVYPSSIRTVRSEKTYNDDTWHHVVATLGARGMELYVDGDLVANDSKVTSAQNYTGYWRIGGDNLSGWPNRPASDYLQGGIDEVAVYPSQLSLAQVREHFTKGGGQLPNAAPTVEFTSAATGLTASFTAAAADTDGQIASYAWDFGDGKTGTGATAEHTYAAPGTYAVTVTVTDDRGATATASGSVIVDLPTNVMPRAAFTSTVSELSATFDASTSTDTDGTIVAYAWDFGDGATSQEAAPQHTYAAAGTYTVSLTVTDDRGGTHTATAPVTVATAPVDPVDPGPAVVGADAFAREVTGSWGTSDTGGAWKSNGSASYFSVAGGQGRMTLRAGTGPSVSLPGVSEQDMDLTLGFGTDKAAVGGTQYVTAAVRGDAYTGYAAKVLMSPTGSVSVSGITIVAGKERTLRSITVPGVTHADGNRYQLRVQAQGTAPTTLRIKVWAQGSPEPDAWQIEVTDATAELAGSGGIGIKSYLGSGATNAPVVFSYTDLKVTKPATAAAP